jgi:hypothetical protein
VAVVSRDTTADCLSGSKTPQKLTRVFLRRYRLTTESHSIGQGRDRTADTRIFRCSVTTLSIAVIVKQNKEKPATIPDFPTRNNFTSYNHP